MSAAVRVAIPPTRPPRRVWLDLEPILDEVVRSMRALGVPLEEVRNHAGTRRIGVSAAFRVSDNLPMVTVHAREQAADTFGAFFPARSGASFAVILPFEPFTLRLEGGDHSEFGYYGIAGAQWHHPSRPLAVGIGIPIQMRDARGIVGLVFQVRMRLDEPTRWPVD